MTAATGPALVHLNRTRLAVIALVKQADALGCTADEIRVLAAAVAAMHAIQDRLDRTRGVTP